MKTKAQIHKEKLRRQAALITREMEINREIKKLTDELRLIHLEYQPLERELLNWKK